MGNAQGREEVFPQATTWFKPCEFWGVFTRVAPTSQHPLSSCCKLLAAKPLPPRSGRAQIYFQGNTALCCMCFPSKRETRLLSATRISRVTRTQPRRPSQAPGVPGRQGREDSAAGFRRVCCKPARWLRLRFLLTVFSSSSS